MNRVLKVLFLFLAKVILSLLIGLRTRHRERLPESGPAILVANHNSHLDTLVLMALFPLSKVHRLRPVASGQYFLQQHRWLAWFSRHVLDIIPVFSESSSTSFSPSFSTSKQSNCDEDSCTHRTFLKSCDAAFAQQQILILYPEGTRGEPERLSDFSSGIAHLAKRHPEVPIIPIFLQGLGKALPKGECLLVPFLCWITIGEGIYWTGKKQTFLALLSDRIQSLNTESHCSFGQP